jgi:glycosyltransferase involved in cell wall biosynthesis
MSHLLVLAPNYTTFIKDQVEALASYWDKVTVLVRYNPAQSLLRMMGKKESMMLCRENLVDYYDVPDNVNIDVYRLIKFIKDDTGASLGKSIANKVIKIIERERLDIDLIHSHFAWPMGYAGMLISKRLGIPNVITAHGYDIYELPSTSSPMRDTVIESLNGADRIITVSSKNAEYVASLDIEKPLTIIPNGYKEDIFRYLPEAGESFRNGLGLAKETKMLVSVGNLKEIKGHKVLVEALSRVQEQRDDVFCYIIGDGPERKLLERMIKSLQLDSICFLVGARKHQEIPLWMNASDMFVLPSLNEGNPTVMFEAMACGKPFIGTRVGGIPDIISSEEYGLLCEPGSSEELADIIIQGLNRNWNMQTILKYSREFMWQHIAERIWKIHLELL